MSTSQTARDVRTDPAKEHALLEGKVTGVHVTVHQNPDKFYICNRVHVLGEDEARGQTVATIVMEDGVREGIRPILLTGYAGNPKSFDDRLEIGSNWEAVITAKFEPPNLGPLAIALVNRDGIIVSDVVGNLGLPWGRHICFFLHFAERAITQTSLPVSVAPQSLTAGKIAKARTSELAAAFAELGEKVQAVNRAFEQFSKLLDDQEVFADE